MSKKLNHIFSSHSEEAQKSRNNINHPYITVHAPGDHKSHLNFSLKSTILILPSTFYLSPYKCLLPTSLFLPLFLLLLSLLQILELLLEERLPLRQRDMSITEQERKIPLGRVHTVIP